MLIFTMRLDYRSEGRASRDLISNMRKRSPPSVETVTLSPMSSFFFFDTDVLKFSLTTSGKIAEEYETIRTWALILVAYVWLTLIL